MDPSYATKKERQRIKILNLKNLSIIDRIIYSWPVFHDNHEPPREINQIQLII